MNIQRCLLSLIILLTPLLAISAEQKRIPAPHRVTAVTVYPDRVLTSRSASLNLGTGVYLVSFDALPALILDDSVRVTGRGSAAARIVAMEVKRVFLEASGEKRVKELDEEIRALEHRTGELDAGKAGLSSQKAFLESIRVAWGERISKELAIGRPTTAELLDAASFVGAGVTKVEQQSLEIEREKKVVRDRIDSLRRQREESVGSRRKESKTVEVTLDVARGGTLNLEIAAVIPQAGWQPDYDVRLAADAKTAELTFRAMVRQQTGEDWNGVDLTLSTARPAAGGAPPELFPWRIAFFRPQPMPPPVMLEAAPAMPAGRKMARKAALYKGEVAASEDEAAEEAPASIETALVSDEHSSVSFHIPRPMDIPSDGSLHAGVVAVEQFPVTMEYVAIPKLSPAVFLRSQIVNRTSYPLLPGKVNTFTGNTYTGSSQLKKVAAGEKFDLYFGSDDQVTVRREELKQQKEAGIFGKNRVSYRYRVEMGNFRREPLTLTLLDQLPLAGDEEIRVSLDEPSVKPDEVANDGRVTWKVPLNGGEKRELTFGILVEYPKDREVTGL